MRCSSLISVLPCWGRRHLLSVPVSAPGTCTWMVMGGLEGGGETSLVLLLVDLEIISAGMLYN